MATSKWWGVALLVSATFLGTTAVTSVEAPAQLLGSTMQGHAIRDIQGAGTTDFGEFTGRLLLVEFFAYW